MKRNVKRNGILLFLAVVAVATFFSFKNSSDRNFQLAKNMDIFNAIVKELDMFYVDTIDPNKAIRDGIDAMLTSLDPYTNYFPEEDKGELEQMLRGSYGGIGSVITYDQKRKRSVIAEPYENMPAAVVGLKAGDILLEIDGEDLGPKTSTEVSEMLRGQVGTSFTLKVERPGTPQPLEFNIVRKSIQVPTVPYYGVYGNKTGYINLSSFSGTPAKEFKEAFLALKKNEGITSLVIDLRNNTGGLLDEAIEIVNFFVPRGKVIVTTKGRISQASSTYKTTREPLDTEIPITVLTNTGTASSSEILAGALQDLDRAVIVGNRTFGKGLVQVPRSLPYGANMKITTSKYYIPSGRSVQAIDYSRKSIDGTSGRIPDSLTNVFHTAAGRIVRDGGGITPDLTVKQERIPNIVYYLMGENLIFNFGTAYTIKNPVIAPPQQFQITDADYEDFKAMVLQSDFKYDQQSAKILKTLKEAAEFEGYMENAKAEFEALEKKLTHNLEHDLEYFKDDIKEMIEIEIVKRHYYQKGSIIVQLKDDSDLKEALRVLSNPEEYRSILAGRY